MLRNIRSYNNLNLFPGLFSGAGLLSILVKDEVCDNGFCLLKKKHVMFVLLFWVAFLFLPSFASASGSCSDPIIIDLSHDPDATWSVPSPVTPDGACCDMPNNFN